MIRNGPCRQLAPKVSFVHDAKSYAPVYALVPALPALTLRFHGSCPVVSGDDVRGSSGAPRRFSAPFRQSPISCGTLAGVLSASLRTRIIHARLACAGSVPGHRWGCASPCARLTTWPKTCEYDRSLAIGRPTGRRCVADTLLWLPVDSGGNARNRVFSDTGGGLRPERTGGPLSPDRYPVVPPRGAG